MNAVGVLNGGASASLLLMAGALAAWTGVDLEADLHLGCVDLAVQYLASSTGEDVEATARVLRRGRDLAFLDVDVRSRAGAPVCHGLVTYRTADYGGRPRAGRPATLRFPRPRRPLPPSRAGSSAATSPSSG